MLRDKGLPMSAKKQANGESKRTIARGSTTSTDSATPPVVRGEELFRLLVSGVKDYAIFMLDPKGHLLTWNEGAERIKGYKASEIIGQHFSVFYLEEARTSNHPQNELAIAKKEGKYEEEGWRVRKDGATFWASVLITAIYDDSELIGYAKVTRDLTERKKAEIQHEQNSKLLAETNRELRRALDAKSQFLSTISHEVRTPMSGIIGMTELLLLEDLGKDNNVVIQTIFESSKRLLQLLNNLLESARMDAGELKLEYREFPIRSVLGEVRQLVVPEASKKHLKLTGRCDASIPEYICGDELRIRQILLNLAFNAVKFTEHGVIAIGCRLKKQDGNDSLIHFSVTDTGVGIKEKDQGKLFQPFTQAENTTTRNYGGAGLGLSISRQLVELMHGKIGFTSKYGEGSTFWFEIPVDQGKCRI